MSEWAVARSAFQLDVFKVDSQGAVLTAAWDSRIDPPGKWRGWWRVADGVAPPHSTVCAVARDPNKLDVFVLGADKGVWTAAWDQNVAGAAWRGWWPIPGLQGSSPPSAVARRPDRLDVFAVADGKIWTAGWAQEIAEGKWRGWWPVDHTAHNFQSGGPPSIADIPVAALSRGPVQLDAFSNDGNVRHATWDNNVAKGAWQQWRTVGDFHPQSRVIAVSPHPTRIDLFGVGEDDLLHNARWDGSQWSSWQPIKGENNALLRIAAVASSPTRAHAFMVSLSPGGQNGVAVAVSDATVGSGEWSALEFIPGLNVHAPRIAAVSRSQSTVDVFALTADGDMFTSAWSDGPNGGTWGPWFAIGG